MNFLPLVIAQMSVKSETLRSAINVFREMLDKKLSEKVIETKEERSALSTVSLEIEKTISSLQAQLDENETEIDNYRNKVMSSCTSNTVK